MYEYKVTVDRVIDGDTVDVDIHLGFNVILNKQRIRLMGIDTPESRTRNLEEKARGLLSKFGRILGVLYKDDETISINQKMCEEGFAVPYFGGSKDELDALHMINKQKLINQGLLEG